MPEAIRFYVDPRCPWCYQTSRWARRLEAAGEVTVDWRPFSLDVANKGDDGRRAPDAGAAPALRVLAEIRHRSGSESAGRFYAAIAGAVHDRGAAVDDMEQLRAAARAAGVEPDLVDEVMADPATWDVVLAEHDEARELKVFGVPTIVLESGDVMFGPIIVDVPEEAEAIELWRHFSWLTRNRNFAELKRERTAMPDLTSIRTSRERRAAERRPRGSAAA
jgi:predicted DsbA family dithiol-disulfide isomerase